MHVDDLSVEDFRNYVTASVALAPGLNLVVGRNAQGKTNLLEAVNSLSGLGSPRGPDSALVREGADQAVVHATVVRGERRVRIDLELRPGRGLRALVNRTPADARTLGEVFTCVFFGPDELSLVKGSPDGRRRFLDDLVVKLRPARHPLRKEFERTLKQKNALLKSAPARRSPSDSVRETLDVWDEAFARASAALVAERLRTLEGLTPFAEERYVSVAGGGRIELTYSSGWADHVPGTPVPSEEELVEMMRAGLATARPKELERGMALVGPQRDDVVVRLGRSETMDARLYASQGDQRTAALALKLAEHDLLTETLNEQPVLLLDDVFSELDPSRRTWLAKAVAGVGQTLVSSADTDAAPLEGTAKVLRVEAGTIS
ncbi:MAG TPA: DNA replication/repair protein RecF [Actinomycetota bacterium]|nr:DNA replication/repair protein RecF [Actinomycetota bacterium]